MDQATDTVRMIESLLASVDAMARAPRKHPDIFTEEEAKQYLRAAGATDRTMETLRREHQLRSFRIGNETMYHRLHLDALVHRLAGVTPRTKSLKLAQG